ncbi:MAG TPA: hypothetical protein VK466_06905 [Terriglobales bacterium]|nr:hypothetical protein [Terriglobales bacterium]
MPVNITSVRLLSLPMEPSALPTNHSSGPASPSAQQIQATINRGIHEAAQNFAPILGANTFTTETNGSGTTLHFGDGLQGKTPPSNAGGEAAYRTGGGTAGNHPTPDEALWVAIRNRTKIIP